MSSAAVLMSRLLSLNDSFGSNSLGDVRPIKRLAEEFEQRFGAGQSPDAGAIYRAVRAFSKTGQVTEYRDLKLVCYGLTMSPGGGAPAVIERPALLEKLFAAVEAIRNKIRQFRRCCQGLLSAYFGVDPVAMSGASAGWNAIRSFLARERQSLLKGEAPPDWVVALDEHKNVLSDEPCARYARPYLAGDTKEFETACARLGIGSLSWMRESVVLAAVSAAVAMSDAQFVERIPTLLELLSTAKKVEALGVRAILNRYAHMESRASHRALRVRALELFGNPLLGRNNPTWSPDLVTPAARQMVADWLKLDVIEQFFELLSHDGVTDRRRPKFWSKYVPIIENIWIVFGAAAQDRRNTDFQALHKLLGDQALQLTGSTRYNNAFVMKIGRRYVIEFGETGNATYIYDEAALPFRLSGALDLRDDLKAGNKKLSHHDGLVPWEDKFRMELDLDRLLRSSKAAEERARTQAAAQAHAIALAQAQARRDAEVASRQQARAQETEAARAGHGAEERPSQQPAPQVEALAGRGAARPQDFELRFREFCIERGVVFKDERHRGGRLTVRASNRDPSLASTLRGWGFIYNDLEERWTLR